MHLRHVYALRGPNIWASFPVLEAWVELGELADVASSDIPGFNDRLMAWLPTLIEHRCSIGERGGFFERLRRGTYPAHILEHVILELQSLAGTPVGFGRARATPEPAVYRVAVEYHEEELGRACLAAARELLLAAIEGKPFDMPAEIKRLKGVAWQVCLGPSTGAIVRAAKARRIPVRRLNGESLVQLGYGAKQHRILTAETDRTGAIAQAIAQDKQLTRNLLAQVGVPVPDGRAVADAEDAWAAVQEIAAAVVVKPQYGNHGRGITTIISTKEEVVAAYATASKESGYILVERFIPGEDYRLLVVNGQMVAAARREAAHVIGDGYATVQELIDRVNADPRRGDGHATVLTKIQLDEIALAVLADEGYAPTSVPNAGSVVRIRRNANLSTGGTATDVTASVHPEISARAVDAARVVGLDIAGIDVIATDITRPLEEQGGAIVEVNAGPGLRMHLEPSAGEPQPVGEAIVSQLFPAGENGRIPVVAVTGTNGKTTTVRLIAHVLKVAGMRVGMTCTDGIYIDGRPISYGDCSGPQSARAVLLNPRVDAAVLETARGGILREGLGFDRCAVGIVTNIADGDHLGTFGVDTPEQLAYVKSTVVAAVASDGASVLNADDPLTANLAQYARGEIIYFSQTSGSPIVAAHCQKGGRAVMAEHGAALLIEGESRQRLVSLSAIPLTRGGAIGFQVENTLAAIAAAWALKIPHETIIAGLATFDSSPDQTPGRFNILQGRGATVIVDYGHNPSALDALIDAISHMPHARRIAVYTVAGDRSDDVIVAQGKKLGDAFDHVVLYEGNYKRGRPEGEIIGLLSQGADLGKRASLVEKIPNPTEAYTSVLEKLQPGHLVLLQLDKIDETLKLVRQYLHQDTSMQDTTENCQADAVRVSDGALGKSVCAARAVEAGQLLLQAWGERVLARGRHSIQVDHDMHILCPAPTQYLNHSCDPNCGLLIRPEEEKLELRALRAIEEGEELTVDYATFEYEISFMPERCLCGAAICRGYITGYKDLPAERRAAYGPYVASYLQRQPEAAAKKKQVPAGV